MHILNIIVIVHTWNNKKKIKSIPIYGIELKIYLANNSIVALYTVVIPLNLKKDPKTKNIYGINV